MTFSVVWLNNKSERMDMNKPTRLSDLINIDKSMGVYNLVGSGRYFIPSDAKLGGL